MFIEFLVGTEPEGRINMNSKPGLHMVSVFLHNT